MTQPVDTPSAAGPINGLNPSSLHLPAGKGECLLDALSARFPSVTREQWSSRFERGRVLDMEGRPLRADFVPIGDLRLRYYREVDTEIVIPFAETVLHVDDDLLIADKPHFLPVIPSGRHVEQTLLARLIHRLGEPDLAPLHRIDAATAGLVMFSRRPATRAIYQALFLKQQISKCYEALAPPLEQHAFPLIRRSRIVKGEPFFRMAETDGEPNSETHIDVIERNSALWRYRLMPVSGKQHQLRVHMAALGAPLCNDDFYPQLAARQADDFNRPLQLLAQSLTFIDPVNGQQRRFTTQRTLLPLADV